jgi:MFS family permease
MMVFALVLGVLVLTDAITVGLVYLLAGLTGLGNAFDNPARRAIITELVDDELAPNAISLNSALMTGSRVVGPTFAAVLISTVGIGWCFVTNGLSFVAVLVALSRLDVTTLHAAPPAPPTKRAVRAGLRYVRHDPELRLAAGIMAVVATLSFNWHIVLPLLAIRTFEGTTTTYTVITTIFSVGSLAGSLWVARRRTIDTHLLSVLATAFGAASMLLALAPTPAIAAATGALSGATGIAYLSATMSLMQVRARPDMRGRVMALYSILFLGSTPIGGPIAGWIAEVFGARMAIGLGAVAALLAGTAGLAALARRHSAAGSPALEPAA